MVDITTSMLGHPLKRKEKPTHWEKRFSSKRRQWSWMQRNMPEACTLAEELVKHFGKLESAQIFIKIKDGQT
jgi:hypothetical protein